jgi:GNAT superfamily N-acetyltransferase
MAERAASTEIRRAQVDDAAEMTRLSVQLGYPLSPGEMARRLAALLTNERHHVAVATGGRHVVGWMHVEHRSTLEGGERAELMGLVVDESTRRQGLGRELVAAAERWAVSRGLASLTVRSNAARELSHPFYEALGYSRDKTQHVYSKPLTSSPVDRASARASS